MSEGNDKISTKKAQTILGKKNSRTGSTPRPQIPRSIDISYAPHRKYSQDIKISDRSVTSNGDSRHIMFEFKSGNEKYGSDTIPIDLVPLQTKGALPSLHKTLINFKRA